MHECTSTEEVTRLKNIPLSRYISTRRVSHIRIIRNNKQCQLCYTSHDDLMTTLLLWTRGTFENVLYYYIHIICVL